MACCGQMRAAAAAGGRVVGASRTARPVAHAVLYQYTGSTGMTVAGPISGRKYRFGAPGSKLQIDPRDALSLAGLPHLRRVG